MSGKHLVCHGAMCQCNFGTAPDKLAVKTHQKEFINDTNGSKQLIASDKDIGPTFEKNTFGSCSKQNNNPCSAVVQEWKGFYDKVTLQNSGKILLEDSKATCPIGGPDCIKIIFHGQTAEVSSGNAKSMNPTAHNVVNPMVNHDELIEEDTQDYY